MKTSLITKDLALWRRKRKEKANCHHDGPNAAKPQPNRVKREKKTHHEGHEVHEERKLTTRGAKSFQSKIFETFVSFVLFV